MRSYYLGVLLCCLCLAVSKYSYTDKCYRFKGTPGDICRHLFVEFSWIVQTYYQFYVNKKGIPHSRDYIVFQSTYSSGIIAYSFYYQWSWPPEVMYSYVLSDCEQVEEGFRCTNTCDSVWFKIENKTEAKSFVEKCDPIFQKKYADVMWDLLNMMNE